jgi:hypothetical protein
VERWFRGGVGARQVSIRGLRALFVAAFIVLGMAGIKRFHLQDLLRDEPRASVHSLVRDATSDEYFRALLEANGIPRASIIRPASKLRSILSTIKENGSLVFVAPRSKPETDVIYQLVRTISLPRKVLYGYCDAPDKTPEVIEPVSAYVLYSINPPPEAQNALSFAPELTVVVAPEIRTWTTFCSR